MRTADPRPRGTDPNRQLRFLLHETGWTQDGMARAVTRLGAESGVFLRYDRTAVARWLRGSRPGPQVQQFVAEAVSRRLGRPVTVRELGMGDGRSGGPGRRPATAPEADYPSADGTSASGRPADRLAALTAPVIAPPRSSPPPATPYRLSLVAHPPAEHAPHVPPPAGPGRRTGPGDVRSVQEHTRFFALQADRYGGGHIRTPLAACLADLVRQLRTGGPGPHHDRLLGGAARMSHLLGRVYTDERCHGLAQRAFLTAADLAAEGGDAQGVALARRALGTQAHRLGHPRTGLLWTESACAAAPAHTPPSTRAFLHAGLAVSRAATGDRRGAGDALHRAERELAGTPTDFTGGPVSPDGEGTRTYQEAALGYQRAQVLRALGDHGAAVRELRASLADRPGDELRSRALSRAELARILHDSGQVEEACAAWHTFLLEAAPVRSRLVDDARRGIPALLARHAHLPCAGALLVRLRTV